MWILGVKGLKLEEQETSLKTYYDQKVPFSFSSYFETMFTKHSPSEILSLIFEKTACSFKLQFSDLMVRHYYTRKDTAGSISQWLLNGVCEHSL